MRKLRKWTYLILFVLLFFNIQISEAYSRPRRNLFSETNGFFIGLTQNRFHFEEGGEATGIGWQAGIIQKTEQRPYGYLTGLLFFDYIKANGIHPEKGPVRLLVNDVVFSLWLTLLWREKSTFTPMVSLGPGFVYKLKSSVKTETEESKYNSSMFDIKGQIAVGAYIKLKNGVYLNPQIFGSYNLLNNNHFAENWGVDQEINYGIQIGLLYSPKN